jgi:phosphocarrier protein
MAGGFASRISVSREDRRVDGKSIMGLLLLTAAQGSVITISADGPDEAEAAEALCALINRGFDEASCV